MSRTKHRKFATLPAILLGACVLSNASADTGTTAWYDVEVIVFKPVKPAADTEVWPMNPAPPNLQNAVTLLPTQPTPQPPAQGFQAFQQLSAGQQQLDAVWRRLQSSGHYQPLLHFAWTQPAAPLATAAPVIIGTPPQSAMANPAGSSPAPAQSQPEAQTPAPNSQSVQYQSAGQSTSQPLTSQSDNLTVQTTAPVSNIYGTVTLSLNRYLHFGVNLLYRGNTRTTRNSNTTGPEIAESDITTHPEAMSLQPGEQNNAGDQLEDQPSGYLLKQSRRIDAGKLNYFDSPMFGVLVLVTPRKLPAPTTLSKPDGVSTQSGSTQQSGNGGDVF